MDEKLLEELKDRADRFDAELLALASREIQVEEESHAVHICIRALEEYIDSIPEAEDVCGIITPISEGSGAEKDCLDSQGAADSGTSAIEDGRDGERVDLIIDGSNLPKISRGDLHGAETYRSEDQRHLFARVDGVLYEVVDEPEMEGADA